MTDLAPAPDPENGDRCFLIRSICVAVILSAPMWAGIAWLVFR